MDIEFNDIGRMKWKQCLKHIGSLRYSFLQKGENEWIFEKLSKVYTEEYFDDLR